MDGSRVLAAQRGAAMRHPGKWEFPGGKVEEDEDDVSALVRELEEELGIRVTVDGLLMEHTHAYPEQTVCLVGMLGRIIAGTPVALEHEQLSWIEKTDLLCLDWAEADKPLVRAIMERF